MVDRSRLITLRQDFRAIEGIVSLNSIPFKGIKLGLPDFAGHVTLIMNKYTM